MPRKLASTFVAVILVIGGSSIAQAFPRQPRTPAIITPTVLALSHRGVLRSPRTSPAEWNRASRVTPVPCEDDPAFLCGSVSVPVDRANPGGRKIDIAFQIFPHSEPGPGRPDPIFVSQGGPGGSTTADRYFYAYYIVEALSGQRDIVLVDQRGTGGSGAIRCRDLQDGWGNTEAFFRAIRSCAAQLGNDADRYGSGDIARDIEAVRKALGYDQINYFAGSYGTVVEQAYGSRFPERLRAIVADAGLPVTDAAHAWGWGLDQPAGHVRAVVLACERAPSCAAEHPNSEGLLQALLDRLTDDPIEGRARDVFGNLRRITVDPEGLFVMTFENRVAAEVTAAADALLNHGDEAPLLRLGAETLFPQGPQGSPKVFSAGANVATYCNDQDFVFSRKDPRPVKRQKFAAARAALSADTFAPWTVEGIDPTGFLGLCAEWPAPDRFVPAVPKGAPPIDVPTLVLAGDFDTDVPTETNERMAEMFADPMIVRVKGAGHIVSGWSQCARDLTARFIQSLAVGDTSCADTPSVVLQAPALFPLKSDHALAATPRANDQSTAHDRKVVWSTVQTVIDAWLRSFRQPAPVADGAGLRDGWFHADYARFNDHAVIDLHHARFVRDVAVRGQSTLSYDFEHPRLRAEVTIHGAGTRDGTLRIVGRYWFDTIFGALRATGRIGNRTIEVKVPGN